MTERDIIVMRKKELHKLYAIKEVEEGRKSQRTAGELLNLSGRQVRRLVKRFREEGEEGITHKSRGKESKRKIRQELRDRVVELYRKGYEGFGPTLFTEKLREKEGIEVSDETVRKWLIYSGDWKKEKKRGRRIRRWRERRSCRGEMLQMDGSHHKWFEERGEKSVLMAYIDDATGDVYGRFYSYEGTKPAMDSFRRYIVKNGIPVSVYTDRHTTYKSPAEPSIEEEIEGRVPLSEFGRALAELGVVLIHAHSPQAKGRVERLFGTLQDRLVKEMSLEGISSIEEGNRFLEEYWPRHNQRFSVAPKDEKDLHRPVVVDLDRVLCKKEERVVKKDNTIEYKTDIYQIEEKVEGKNIMVEERLDDTIVLSEQGRLIKFKKIPWKPLHQQKSTPKRRVPSIPSPNHPWRNPSRKK